MRRNQLSSIATAAMVAFGVTLASWWIFVTSVHTYCEQRPAFGVLAMLAAFSLALALRQFARVTTRAARILLLACACLSGAVVYFNVSSVIHFNRICHEFEQNLRRLEQK